MFSKSEWGYPVFSVEQGNKATLVNILRQQLETEPNFWGHGMW